MENLESSQEVVKVSVEKIIDLIRETRNNMIKDFLVDTHLKSYFTELYRKELTSVKTEFLKRDLKELLIAPVDLIHYAALIKQIRETNAVQISSNDRQLFTLELETIFKKYNF